MTPRPALTGVVEKGSSEAKGGGMIIRRRGAGQGALALSSHLKKRWERESETSKNPPNNMDN